MTPSKRTLLKSTNSGRFSLALTKSLQNYSAISHSVTSTSLLLPLPAVTGKKQPSQASRETRQMRKVPLVTPSLHSNSPFSLYFCKLLFLHIIHYYWWVSHLNLTTHQNSLCFCQSELQSCHLPKCCPALHWCLQWNLFVLFFRYGFLFALETVAMTIR